MSSDVSALVDSSDSAGAIESGPESEEDIEDDIEELLDHEDDDSPFEDDDFEAEDTPRASKARKTNGVKKGRQTTNGHAGAAKPKKPRAESGPALHIATSAYVPVWIPSKRPTELEGGALDRAASAAMAFAHRAKTSSSSDGKKASLTELSSAYQRSRQESKRKTARVVVLSDDDEDGNKAEELIPCEFCQSAFPPTVLLAHQRRCQEEHVRREKLAFMAIKKEAKKPSLAPLPEAHKPAIEVIDLSDEERLGKEFHREQDQRVLQQRASQPQPAPRRLKRRVPDEESGPVRVSDEESGEVVVQGALRSGRMRGEERAEEEAEEEEEEDDDDAPHYVDQHSDEGDAGANLVAKCEAYAAEKRASLGRAGAVVTKQPETLQKELNDYQLVGVNWLCQLHAQDLNGILADEMGLGKTVQTIALFAQLKADGCQHPHLVIVPATTLDNWKRELALWCPALSVCVYYGSLKERENQRVALLRGAKHDVLLTTYNFAFQRLDRAFLKRLQFEYLVLDEAHNVKNSASQRHQRLSRLPARHRLLLTGTPLQNNLGELWALLSFLMPRIFVNGDAMPALLREGDVRQLERMKAILAPFILRRLKSQVQRSLKPKHETVELTRLEEATQLPLYKKLVAGCKGEWAANSKKLEQEAEEEEEGEKENEDEEAKAKRGRIAAASSSNTSKRKSALINIIMQLQKACNHPCLFRIFYSDQDLVAIARTMRRDEWERMTQDEAEANLRTYSDFELHGVCLDYDSLASLRLPDEKLLYSSAKMVHLRKSLPALLAGGHRVLLFSQMTRVLDILEVLLDRLGLSFLRLDGNTPVVERQSLIDRFNAADSAFSVFLLSTKAGGLGINLTSADTVFFYDSSFNPHTDRQAEDRCHRIGQKKEVTVYRFVSEGTVEEHIRRRAADKMRLNDAVLEEGGRAERQHVSDILRSVFTESK